MKNWLRFLWEEESTASPTLEVESAGGATGVPRLLWKATHWSAIAVVGAALMGQIIGVRLIAPVDADTSYTAACRNRCVAAQTNCLAAQKKNLTACNLAYNACLKGCATATR